MRLDFVSAVTGKPLGMWFFVNALRWSNARPAADDRREPWYFGQCATHHQFRWSQGVNYLLVSKTLRATPSGSVASPSQPTPSAATREARGEVAKPAPLR